jgi:hypothetical protein
MIWVETVAERLDALFRRNPSLADGEHDKELIAKYLEVYHGHVIPPTVLAAIPSFETIRRMGVYLPWKGPSVFLQRKGILPHAHRTDSCTKSRTTYSIAARELFQPSALVRGALRYLEGRVDCIYILSSKYGLLPLDHTYMRGARWIDSVSCRGKC